VDWEFLRKRRRKMHEPPERAYRKTRKQIAATKAKKRDRKSRNKQRSRNREAEAKKDRADSRPPDPESAPYLSARLAFAVVSVRYERV
jgi:hypothetical protein